MSRRVGRVGRKQHSLFAPDESAQPARPAPYRPAQAHRAAPPPPQATCLHAGCGAQLVPVGELDGYTTYICQSARDKLHVTTFGPPSQDAVVVQVNRIEVHERRILARCIFDNLAGMEAVADASERAYHAIDEDQDYIQRLERRIEEQQRQLDYLRVHLNVAHHVTVVLGDEREQGMRQRRTHVPCPDCGRTYPHDTFAIPGTVLVHQCRGCHAQVYAVIGMDGMMTTQLLGQSATVAVATEEIPPEEVNHASSYDSRE